MKGGSDPAFYFGLFFDDCRELCYILATQNPEVLMISEKVKAIFSESQVMMLIEDYDRTLKLVFEGITAIDKKIDTVEERLIEPLRRPSAGRGAGLPVWRHGRRYPVLGWPG